MMKKEEIKLLKAFELGVSFGLSKSDKEENDAVEKLILLIKDKVEEKHKIVPSDSEDNEVHWVKITEFLEEHKPNDYPVNEYYNLYVSWWKKNNYGVMNLSKIMFGKFMNEQGYKSYSKRINGKTVRVY